MFRFTIYGYGLSSGAFIIESDVPQNEFISGLGIVVREKIFWKVN